MSVGVDSLLSWRRFADALKRTPWVLRVADRLGRGRGRFRPMGGWLPVPAAPRRPDVSAFVAADFAACWLGHATMLYRIGGKTILVDPVLGARVGMDAGFMTLGPRRKQRPALTLAELPPIDLLAVTHAHFDHLDRPTLHRLPKDVDVVTAPGVAGLLDDLGFRAVREITPGQSIEIAGVEVGAVQTKHWGPRVFFDDHRGYIGFTFAGGGKRILHTGDTADTDAFDGGGPFNLAAFGIGAYDPYIAAHASPEQVWRMFTACGAERLAAYHHTTFKLSREPMDEPLQRLLAAAGDQAERVVIRGVGDTWVTRCNEQASSEK
ncbi:MAG: MBL fold metallo-hydrolase [Planctomycetota bacterium]